MGYTGNYNLYYPSGSQPINPVGGGDNGQFFMMMQSVDELFWSVEQIATQARDAAQDSANSAAQSASNISDALDTAQAALDHVDSIPRGHSNVGYDTDDVPYVIDQAQLPLSGSGSPIGTLTPDGVGQEYTDTAVTTGARKWIATGTTDQDWIVTEGDTGWCDITSRLGYGWGAAMLKVRRHNERVYLAVDDLDPSASTSAMLMASLPDGFTVGVAPSGLQSPLSSGTSPGDVSWWGFFGGPDSNYLRSSAGANAGLLSGTLEFMTDSAWPTSIPS